MSEDELRQLCCLPDSNDPKETPFSVDAKLSWNMYQLTKAIQGKKVFFLISTLLIWSFGNEEIVLTSVDVHARLSSQVNEKSLPLILFTNGFQSHSAIPALRCTILHPKTKVSPKIWERTFSYYRESAW
jgi:hypothetical protein